MSPFFSGYVSFGGSILYSSFSVAFSGLVKFFFPLVDAKRIKKRSDHPSCMDEKSLKKQIPWTTVVLGWWCVSLGMTTWKRFRNNSNQYMRWKWQSHHMTASRIPSLRVCTGMSPCNLVNGYKEATKSIPKTNMDPEKTHLEKEKHLPTINLCVPC